MGITNVNMLHICADNQRFYGNVTSIKNKLNKNFFIIILYIWDVTVTSHIFTDYQTFKYKSM